MTIREGTLVTRFTGTNHTNPCYDYVDWDKHSEAGTEGNLDVCIGVVIEAMKDNPDITVNWLQMCPCSQNHGIPAQQRLPFMEVYEVGQLA